MRFTTRLTGITVLTDSICGNEKSLNGTAGFEMTNSPLSESCNH